MTTKHNWKSGKPPHVGWWVAQETTIISRHRENYKWRWWNGKCWSIFCLELDDISDVIRYANEQWPQEMFYSDYWPENARVPRIDPRVTK